MAAAIAPRNNSNNDSSSSGSGNGSGSTAATAAAAAAAAAATTPFAAIAAAAAAELASRTIARRDAGWPEAETLSAVDERRLHEAGAAPNRVEDGLLRRRLAIKVPGQQAARRVGHLRGDRDVDELGHASLRGGLRHLRVRLAIAELQPLHIEANGTNARHDGVGLADCLFQRLARTTNEIIRHPRHILRPRGARAPLRHLAAHRHRSHFAARFHQALAHAAADEAGATHDSDLLWRVGHHPNRRER